MTLLGNFSVQHEYFLDRMDLILNEQDAAAAAERGSTCRKTVSTTNIEAKPKARNNIQLFTNIFHYFHPACSRPTKLFYRPKTSC